MVFFIGKQNFLFFFFFFQAEDGIRDLYVTGVQTLLFRSIRAREGATRDGTSGERKTRAPCAMARRYSRSSGAPPTATRPLAGLLRTRLGTAPPRRARTTP